MAVRPKQEMYGKRIGIIVEARAVPSTMAAANESICLEGVLSESCMPTTGPDNKMFSEVYDPKHITLEGGVKAPNIGNKRLHPLSEGVPSITVDNDYVIAMYEPREETEDSPTKGGTQPE